MAKKGLRSTDQRRVIVDIFLASGDHVSIEELLARVRAQDPGHPEYGTIDLIFTADPLALRQWVITDDLGQPTTVILGEMKLGGSYPVSLFSLEMEKKARGF